MISNYVSSSLIWLLIHVNITRYICGFLTTIYKNPIISQHVICTNFLPFKIYVESSVSIPSLRLEIFSIAASFSILKLAAVCSPGTDICICYSFSFYTSCGIINSSFVVCIANIIAKLFVQSKFDRLLSPSESMLSTSSSSGNTRNFIVSSTERNLHFLIFLVEYKFVSYSTKEN